VQGGALQWVQTPPGNRSSRKQSEQRLGSRMVTYADDLVILCKKGKTDEVLQQLRKIMSKLKLKLTVNEEKTRIWKGRRVRLPGPPVRTDVLSKNGQARLGYRPSKKCIKRMVEQIHALTDRRRWQEITTV
jgi:RNA-directed DNA polymerase